MFFSFIIIFLARAPEVVRQDQDYSDEVSQTDQSMFIDEGEYSLDDYFRHPAGVMLLLISHMYLVCFLVRGCLEERKSALQSDGGAHNMYVPECTADGQFERAQCHSRGTQESECMDSTSESLLDFS
jgi:hypothetical protein